MDFRTFDIPGHEGRNIVALKIDGYCVAVGSRDDCLALFEEDEPNTDVDPRNRQGDVSTAAA